MPSKLKNKKTWRIYLIELFVVFFGVTSAFLLNSWRENRQIDKMERSYIENIYSDLIMDRDKLEEVIAIGEEHHRMLSRFLFDQGDDWTVDSTGTVLGYAMTVAAFEGKTTTYESLKYSGHLSHIRDFDLRTTIVDYYEFFENVRVVEGLHQYWITQNMSPFLVEHFNMRQFRFEDESIIDSIAFQNRMHGLFVLLSQNLGVYREIQELNNMLTEMLEES